MNPAGLMKQDITVVVSGGFDKWQEPEATTNSAQKARVQLGTELMLNRDGEQVFVRAVIYTQYLSLTHNDKVTYAGTTYSVAAIEHHIGGDGVESYVKAGLI